MGSSDLLVLWAEVTAALLQLQCVPRLQRVQDGVQRVTGLLRPALTPAGGERTRLQALASAAHEFLGDVQAQLRAVFLETRRQRQRGIITLAEIAAVDADIAAVQTALAACQRLVEEATEATERAEAALELSELACVADALPAAADVAARMDAYMTALSGGAPLGVPLSVGTPYDGVGGGAMVASMAGVPVFVLHTQPLTSAPHPYGTGRV
jgi:hypothetical protein